MERLTIYTPDGYESINPVDLELDEYSDINFERLLDKLGQYEDFEEIFREKMTDTACEFLSDKEEFGLWLDRNKWNANKCNEYAIAEEQGLLLRLPCKVGDTVYKPNPITLSEIVEIKIESIFITESKINISGRTTKMKYSFCCSPSDFGKTVFLTKAEAERKLKEMEV